MSQAVQPAPIGRWLAAAGPPLLYGCRLTAGVALALFVAFFLQLDNPGWAGTSAAIVAQPVLGASLRKGLFRLVGTLVGAVASVLLTALFPQDRVPFFVGMALWCAACSFAAALLRNFASYAGVLAGYTLVIVATAAIEAPTQVFLLAVGRGSEIALGIVCSMAVMTLTDIGTAPARLAGALDGLGADVLAGLRAEIGRAGQGSDARPERRALVGRVVGLEPLLDQAAGEAAGGGPDQPVLRAGVNGLFVALSAWRTIGAPLRGLPPAGARDLADRLLEALPAPRPAGGEPPSAARDRCLGAARQARDAPATSASARLGLDRVAAALDGLARAANAALLLREPRGALPFSAATPLRLPDALPPFVNALRVAAAVVVAEAIVVATAWPAGYTFLTFAAVTTLLMAPQAERAGRAALGFGVGTVLAAALAALVKFALLPNQEGYGTFVLILSAVLVPLAALSTRPAFGTVLVPATMNFVPLLGPTNVTTFDTAGFANSALAIVGGCLFGATMLALLPHVPAEARARRLRDLTLADLRRAMRRPGRLTADAWRRRVYGRLQAIPPGGSDEPGSEILAALTVGLQMIALRAALPPAERGPVATAEAALARADVGRARAALDMLGAGGEADASPERLRTLGAAREVGDTLRAHAGFFGGAAA